MNAISNFTLLVAIVYIVIVFVNILRKAIEKVLMRLFVKEETCDDIKLVIKLELLASLLSGVIVGAILALGVAHYYF